MSINEIQDQIVDDFLMMDDWMDRYNLLIEQSKELPIMDAKYKTEKYLIEGCQSRVWINCEQRDGLLFFSADSDAIIAKGLIALLVKVLNGQSAKQVYECDLYFIEKIGMKENLTPTRANGLVSMIRQMKMFALAYMSTNQE
ncbi:MAG: SufE family protein [Rikenellaceae bacterium]